MVSDSLREVVPSAVDIQSVVPRRLHPIILPATVGAESTPDRWQTNIGVLERLRIDGRNRSGDLGQKPGVGSSSRHVDAIVRICELRIIYHAAPDGGGPLPYDHLGGLSPTGVQSWENIVPPVGAAGRSRILPMILGKAEHQAIRLVDVKVSAAVILPPIQLRTLRKSPVCTSRERSIGERVLLD